MLHNLLMHIVNGRSVLHRHARQAGMVHPGLGKMSFFWLQSRSRHCADPWMQIQCISVLKALLDCGQAQSRIRETLPEPVLRYTSAAQDHSKAFISQVYKAGQPTPLAQQPGYQEVSALNPPATCNTQACMVSSVQLKKRGVTRRPAASMAVHSHPLGPAVIRPSCAWRTVGACHMLAGRTLAPISQAVMCAGPACP